MLTKLKHFGIGRAFIHALFVFMFIHGMTVDSGWDFVIDLVGIGLVSMAFHWRLHDMEDEARSASV